MSLCFNMFIVFGLRTLSLHLHILLRLCMGDSAGSRESVKGRYAGQGMGDAVLQFAALKAAGTARQLIYLSPTQENLASYHTLSYRYRPSSSLHAKPLSQDK